MRKVCYVFFMCFILFSLLAGMTEMKKEEKLNFEAFSKKVAKLYKEKKYDDVISLYEKAIPKFPGKVFDLTMVLTRFYMFRGEHEKCLDIFEYGLQHKAVYPILPGSAYWQPLEKYERFKKIIAENNRLKKALTAVTEPRYEVSPPAGFSTGEKYPLFLVLHGWNESLHDLKKHWQSSRIAGEFLLVLCQSSQVAGSHKFGWENEDLTKKDIKTIFTKVTEQYPVNPDKIIIAGFSQGGMAAIEAAVTNVIPATGFIGCQPGGPVPAGISVETLTKARRRGLRGTIILREQDKSDKDKMEMVKRFQEADFPFRYILSGSTHWYPEDFSQQLDSAISDIADKEEKNNEKKKM